MDGFQWWQSRTVSAAPVAGWNFLSWRRKYNLCWAFFTMDSMYRPHFRSWEMVVLRNLNDLHCSHSAVHDGEWGRAGGFLLKSTIISSFEHVELQVVKIAQDSQLLNLMSVSRLFTVLDEADQCGVVCKLQERDWGGLWMCSCLCRERRAVGTQPRSSSADRMGAGCVFPSLISSLSVRKMVVHWQTLTVFNNSF